MSEIDVVVPMRLNSMVKKNTNKLNLILSSIKNKSKSDIRLKYDHIDIKDKSRYKCNIKELKGIHYLQGYGDYPITTHIEDPVFTFNDIKNILHEKINGDKI